MGEPNEDNSIAIGIDLGTTYSCVAVYRNNAVEIIANDESQRTTPSVVAFTDHGTEISMQAKNEALLYPKSTIFGIKRLIGRKFTDEIVQADMKTWPFDVVDVNGDPEVNVIFKDGKTRQISPVEISALILERMKKIAEDFVGQQITKAVITVPAYFNNAQREATKKAGSVAKLDVLRILNEPTAAGIAYGFDNQLINDEQNNKPRKILVFDFGGGTFDVSILNICQRKYTVLSTAGDNHLGGEDLDNTIVNHFVDVILKHLKEDIRNNHRAMSRLRTKCEEAKRVLSTNESANITIEALSNGKDFNGTLSRNLFNNLNQEHFNKLRAPIHKALDSAKLKPEQIDDVILVGGSTRVHAIQELVREIFKKDPCQNINPDEAVAYGAAILAASLQPNKNKGLADISVDDVIPISLGIATAGGRMSRIIEGNTAIPATKNQTFTTNYDDQVAINFAIYEGDRPLIADNNLLGEFLIRDIAPSPREIPKVKVEFNIDQNGILNVSAMQVNTGQAVHKTIQADCDKWTPERLAEMRYEVDLFKEIDDEQCKIVDAKISLEEYCLIIRNRAKKDFDAPVHVRTTLQMLSQDTLDWLSSHQNATLEEYREALQQLKIDCEENVNKLTL